MGRGGVVLAAASVVLLVIVAAIIALIVKRRTLPPVTRRHGGRSRKLHRSMLAAALVAPGAFLSTWGFSARATESNFGVVLGWIPGIFAAMILGGLAYLLVESARRSFRTPLAIAIAIAANAAYLAVLLNYSISHQ
jgi:hypothetical protein